MIGSKDAIAELLETSVPGLDRILGGGIRRRSLGMIIGSPGSGKTLLAEQIVFHNAAQGASALFLTGFSETHEKLLSHTCGLAFFNPELVGTLVHYASLLDLLRSGADETVDAIVATVRAQQATLVILDGFRGMRGFLADDQQAAYFLYSLGAKLALLGATTLIVVEGDSDNAEHFPELTVCDVILSLRREMQNGRQRRLLEVVKARGSAPIEGIHPFVINDTGVVVFPRFEALVPLTDPAWDPGRAAFGIPDFDALLSGGPNRGSATLVAGSPGVGKTLLGLHFLAAGVRAQEPVLFLGFMENPAQLREKARMFGMDLSAAEGSGQLRYLVLPAHDLEANRIGALLAEDIERRGVQRLVIDSAVEIDRAVGSPDGVANFIAALASFLRGRQITSYLTIDIPMIVGTELSFTGTPISLFAENLLLLRHVEYYGRLHRVLSVLKMRFSDFDSGIYEVAVRQGHGIELVGPAPLGEGLLTGVPRVVSAYASQQQPNASPGAL